MMKNIMKNLKNRKGFTIIELIVVMAVLAILVGLGAPKFLGYTKDAKVTAQQTDGKVLEQAIYQYQLKNDDALPVDAVNAVATADITDTNTQTIMTSELGSAYSGFTFAHIDSAKVAPFVKSTANPLADYVMVTSAGDKQGEVFDLNAQVDSSGVFHSALYK